MVEYQSILTLIRDIIRISRGGVEAQSETISDRQIELWIHQYRAMLIKQDLDKGKYPNPSYIQELKGLKLSPVDASEIDSKPINRYVLKSNLRIPKLIDLNYSQGITYIGTADGREIQVIPQSRSKWQQYKTYTNNDPLVYLKDQYLYLVNGEVIENINIRGLFEIPMEVELFNNPVIGVPTYNPDTFKYPIPINMLGPLKDLILSKELGMMLKTTSDTDNNASNDNLNDAKATKRS